MVGNYTSLSFLAGSLAVVSLFIGWYTRRDPMLDAIPTIGFSDPILSYISALKFYFNAIPMLKEGYQKTRPGLFKIANFRKWIVLASGPELIDDIKRAPDDVLSVGEAVNEILQAKYTLDVINPKDELLTEIVRSKLTRDIASTFDNVREELIMAMDDLIPESEDEWVTIPFMETMQRVICRTTNRIFVGIPLCRNHDYQNLNIGFTISVMKFAITLSWFPRPLKFIVSRIISNISAKIQQQADFIRPMVEERIAKLEEYGDDWDDKPNDMIMWLVTKVKGLGVERSAELFARRLLLANFVSIHTTSTTLTQAIYRLLSNPEYIKPLRGEVDAAIAEEGWTKAGIDKMNKIDSFLRETQRIDGISALANTRLVLRPFTLSNGMTIPANTMISIPASPIHMDERIYSNPDEFDGFRFSKLRELEGQATAGKYQSVSPSNEHLPFGIGRHTCPGRFFAVNEIKLLFAYIIATYDIRFEEGKSAPPGFFIDGNRPPGSANVMFRARKK